MMIVIVESIVFAMKHQLIRKINGMQFCWLLEASWRLLLVQAMLKVRSAQWLNNKLRKVRNETDVKISQVLDQAERMHEAVRLAARCQFRQPDCLPKSIVLCDMLQYRNYPAQLRIGVNRTEQRLFSHAWVELYGHMIAEPEQVSVKFTRLK